MTISVYADPSGNYATMSIGGSEKLRLNSDGTATLSGVPVLRSALIATKNATGNFVDFTSATSSGIPTWAKKVKVVFNNVGTPGVYDVKVQLYAANSLVTTGYTSSVIYLVGGTNPVFQGHTSAVWVVGSGVSTILSGKCTLDLQTGNTWVSTGQVQRLNDTACQISSGQIALGDQLTGIRIEATSGTFDAGSISVYVEG